MSSGHPSVRMPFGKYAGHLVENLPKSYLTLCLSNLENMGPALRAEMRRCVSLDPCATTRSDIQPAAIVSTFDAALEIWYRSASREYHPDHGGDTRGMIIVNSVYESLSRVISEMGSVK
jgi:hypothetical protein